MMSEKRKQLSTKYHMTVIPKKKHMVVMYDMDFKVLEE